MLECSFMNYVVLGSSPVADLYLFVENSDLSNCADDNTLYSSGKDMEKVKQNLR